MIQIQSNNTRGEISKSNTIPGFVSASIPEKLVNYLQERQKNILEGYSSEYLTLEELSSLIRKDPNLPEYSKKRVVLNYAIKDILVTHNESEKPRAFIYPFVFVENNKIVCKIYIMTPIKDTKAEVDIFNKYCFKLSSDSIKLIVNAKYTSSKRLNETNYKFSLIRDNRVDEKYYSPFEHSIEEELRSICKRAFKPYQYIEVNEFIKDVINYGKNLNKLIEITPEYHINNTQIFINDDGEIKKDIEIYYHFYSQFTSLEKVVINELLIISKAFSMTMISEEIENYSNSYPIEISNIPENELKRANHLIDIVQAFPGESILPEKEKKLLKSFRKSANILKNIVSLIPIYAEIRYKTLLNNCILRFKKKVEFYSSEKKVLLPIQLNEIISYAFPNSIDQSIQIEKEIRKIILNEMGSVEVLGFNGEREFYLIDPNYIHRVVQSLAKLGFQNEIARKQFTISKAILNQLQTKNREINLKLDPIEMEEILNTLPSLENQIQKIEFKEKTQKLFFSFISLLIFTLSPAYLFFLKINFQLPTRELLMLPLGIIVSKLIHSIFQFKRDK